jgi:trehalose-6-phosphate synthase
MLGANLVCFQVRKLSPFSLESRLNVYVQTYSYSRHFASSCIRVCGYESASKGIEVDGHIASITHSPVGIDAERVARDM